MSDARLTPERIAAIRDNVDAHYPDDPIPEELLGHIAAQDAEIAEYHADHNERMEHIQRLNAELAQVQAALDYANNENTALMDAKIQLQAALQIMTTDYDLLWKQGEEREKLIAELREQTAWWPK